MVVLVTKFAEVSLSPLRTRLTEKGKGYLDAATAGIVEKLEKEDHIDKVSPTYPGTFVAEWGGVYAWYRRDNRGQRKILLFLPRGETPASDVALLCDESLDN